MAAQTTESHPVDAGPFRFTPISGEKKSEYLLYLQDALQTMYCNPKRVEPVGNYLSILTWTSTHTH
jgi:hypothetical protein